MARPSKRLIVGILSSEPYASRRDQCRKTWLAALAAQPDGEAVFIVGDPSVPGPSRDGDVLRVPCPDDYDALPQKVQIFIDWALANYDFDYLFKCDDDTYVCVPRLLRLDLLGRAYVGSLCGRYAQGGAGYFLSRRAAGLVAEGLKVFPSGPEDLFVGRILRERGVPLSADWRFRADCRPANVPRPGNMIVTCHRCRSDEMERIHPPFAGVVAEPDPGNALFTVDAWAADYGMLGLGGDLGFSVDGRSRVQSSVIGTREQTSGCQLVSAHAGSRVVINVHEPVDVSGFLDDDSKDRPKAPVLFVVDDRPLGTLWAPGVRTADTPLSPGRHTLVAKCLNPHDNGRRYSAWAIRPRKPRASNATDAAE